VSYGLNDGGSSPGGGW